MNINIKDIVIGAAIGGAIVGGVLYSKYIKNAGEAAGDQVSGYHHVLDCVVLLGSDDKEKLKTFLQDVVEKQAKLAKSDSIVTTISSIANGEVKVSGMGEPLRQCTKTLAEQFETLNNKS
ncbi:hypothetical protein [Neptuniibacter sp. QD34_54]|uniref:hypothetical protein n=1 Tax=Neptuniibacter sp. QD34_54 TaxID=3398208 RepID=UPI0039F4833E